MTYQTDYTGTAPVNTHNDKPDGEYDCAYCPLGGVGAPVMLDGHPAHPYCADALYGATPPELAEVRWAVAECLDGEQPDEG